MYLSCGEPELIFWIFRRLSLSDFFNMIMIVDVDGASKEFQKYTAELEAAWRRNRCKHSLPERRNF